MNDLPLLLIGIAVLLIVFVIGGVVIELLGIDDRIDARRRNGR